MLNSDCDGAEGLAGAAFLARGGRNPGDAIEDPKMLSFSKFEREKSDCGDSIWERPCGSKELEADGGLPAGVFDRLLNKLPDFPGVDGGLESKGTLNVMMLIDRRNQIQKVW